jgi:glycosyltransferase involved in cell wall biosynthesis
MPVSSGASFRTKACSMHDVSLVIPALDEAESIGGVVSAALALGIGEAIVVDNGSTDATAPTARAAGARVVSEPRRGYGRACAAGVAAVRPGARAIAFLAGDGSDVPSALADLARIVLEDRADFAIGSRTRGIRERKSLSALQFVAGRTAGFLVGICFGTRYTDMGPQRVIGRSALARLPMSDETYGWNLQMQILAARAKLRIVELPVPHRCRCGGESKVSGNLRAAWVATFRIALVFSRNLLTAPSKGDRARPLPQQAE